MVPMRRQGILTPPPRRRENVSQLVKFFPAVPGSFAPLRMTEMVWGGHSCPPLLTLVLFLMLIARTTDADATPADIRSDNREGHDFQSCSSTRHRK